MMFREEIVFGGGINTDDDARAVPKGDYRDMTYSRLGDVSGHGFCVVTSLGTTKIENPSITESDRVLGGFVWEAENAIVYPVYRYGADDEIWAYYLDSQSNGLICSSSAFNFDRDTPILHGNIIGNLFKFVQGYWTDAMYDTTTGERLFNPPFQIDLRKALDGEYPVIDLQVIDAVKWPLEPPVCVYSTDQARADNKLRRKLFRFMVQPIYENGEEGNWSMYSNLAYPSQSEFVSGNNWPDPSVDNVIEVTFNTGPNVVKKINVAVQQYDENSFGAENPFGIFLQLNKSLESINDDEEYTVSFYGGVSTKPIVYSKNYDRLPLWAACQEYLVTNELTYVNFREGFDKTTVLDVTTSYDKYEIEYEPSYAKLTVAWEYLGGSGLWVNFWENTDPSDDYFNVAIGDNFTLTIKVTSPVDVYIQLSYTITAADYAAAVALGGGYAGQYYLNEVIVNAYVDQINAVLGTDYVQATEDVGPPSAWYITQNLAPSWVVDNPGRLLNAPVYPLRQTRVVPSLKTGATHEFGIVYGDRAYRDGTVYTDDSLSVFVKFPNQEDLSAFTDPNNPYYVNPRISINHLPPVWATHYWIVAREATEILSFGQWIINSDPNILVDPLDNASSTAIFSEVNRWRIDLDQYYISANNGASINFTPQKGDVARFIRKQITNTVDPSAPEYTDSYFELEVLDFDITGGEQGRMAIWVEQFDLTMLGGGYTGQLLEIYRPRPAVDTDGSLFVSEWRDVTGALGISNPHTVDRGHECEKIIGSADLYYDGVQYVYLHGNFTNYIGSTISVVDDSFMVPFNQLGVIDTATYIAGENPTGTSGTTLIVISGGWTQFGFTSTTTCVFSLFIGSDQVVSSGVSSSPAELKLSYGDVYVRQRNYLTGYKITEDIYVAYWFIEDPNYSDYWVSDVHQVGRYRVEDPNAKMVHRQAAIHSDPFILGTQINGLSTFSLSNDNIQDLNPIHGEVTRAFNAGREGKTLKCLQPRKESSIYINFYPDVTDTPQGNLRVDRNRTFSSWFDFNSLYGCRDGGGAALLPDGTTVYFDPINQVFVYSAGNGQMIISELDPLTKNNFKFRKKTREITNKFNTQNGIVRTYVNESMGEVGFGFRFEVNPSQSGNITFFNDGQTEVVVEGNEAALAALIGNTINFELEQDDPDNPIYYFTTTIVDVSSSFLGVILTLADTTPVSAVTGTYSVVGNYEYEILVFDYVRMRWRARYDYPFECFANFGSTLIGFGTDEQLYLHNQNSFTFHGEDALQTIQCVSNENPMLLKRYQTLIERADKTWDFECYSDANQSYGQMATRMAAYLFEVFEGYSQVDFSKNENDVSYPSAEMARMNGEDVRANALTMTVSYSPVENNASSVLFSLGILGVLS